MYELYGTLAFTGNTHVSIIVMIYILGHRMRENMVKLSKWANLGEFRKVIIMWWFQITGLFNPALNSDKSLDLSPEYIAEAINKSFRIIKKDRSKHGNSLSLFFNFMQIFHSFYSLRTESLLRIKWNIGI